MRNYGKKILGIVAAATMLCSVAVSAGCSKTDFKMIKPNQTDYVGEVRSNGGFAVQKGNYVYFINGVQSNTANNTYGEVEKGALMRITTKQLAEKEYDKAEVVVPSLFVSQKYEAGVFIYDDYVYYATPTTDKNLEGKVENSYIDFKRAKLDGTEEPMKGKYFHLANSAAFYRFVKMDDGIVYCLYEEDGALKSFNTKTKKHTVLVEGATQYYYDAKNLENGNVYYTMPVTYEIDKTTQSTADYNQLYCVNAAAKATSVGKKAKGKIGYTAVCNGESKEYTFDADYLEDYKGFEAKDHSTYPYVNLGQLVLDGVGSISHDAGWFNEDDKADSLEPYGFKYEIARYENDGVYFTRSGESQLYYLSDTRSNWNTVKGNDEKTTKELDVVANDTSKAAADALFEVEEKNGARVHTYVYVDAEVKNLYKATAKADGTADETLMERDVDGITLWKTEGDFLYFYADSEEGNGSSLSRIKYKGYQDGEDVYNEHFAKAEGYEDYQPITIALVDWNKDWYKPEIFNVGKDSDGNDKAVVLYSNVQKYGNSLSTYNYVYAAQIGTTAEIQENIDKYEAYTEYLKKYSSNDDSSNLIRYFFGAGTLLSEEETALSQEIIDLYNDDNKPEEKDAFYKEVLGKFTVAEGAEKAELATESEIIGLVGKITKKDKNKIATAWKDSLLSPKKAAAKDEKLPGWAVALIVVGSVLIVAAGAAVPVVMYIKKKEAAKKEAEATVNAYRRKKIDTTDDKTIDVYAEDKAAEEPAKEAEEVAEEPAAERTADVEESTPEEADGEEATQEE